MMRVMMVMIVLRMTVPLAIWCRLKAQRKPGYQILLSSIYDSPIPSPATSISIRERKEEQSWADGTVRNGAWEPYLPSWMTLFICRASSERGNAINKHHSANPKCHLCENIWRTISNMRIHIKISKSHMRIRAEICKTQIEHFLLSCHTSLNEEMISFVVQKVF